MAERRELVPQEILRLLSTHDEVRLIVGAVDDRDMASSACLVVPFESVLFLMVRKGGRAAEALRMTNAAKVAARTNEYSIELNGRAFLGPPLALHPRRLELVQWLPEGTAQGRFEVVHLWTEEVDYRRGEEEFFGKTAASRDLPRASTLWMLTAYNTTWPLLVLGLPLATLYIAWGDVEARWVPVLLTWIVVPAWVAGPGLWFRARAFEAWRSGHAPVERSGVIGEALLPPGRVFGTAVTVHVLGLLAWLPMWWWSTDIPGIVFFCGFLWLTWPIAMTRIFTGDSTKEK